MKIRKMPITYVLLGVSWIIVALGILYPVYLFRLSGLNQSNLVTSSFIFLFCLILGAGLRMFANIGQIVFHIRQDLQKVWEINNTCSLQLFNLKKELQSQKLSRDNNINSLKEEIRIQTTELDRIIREMDREIIKEINSVSPEVRNQTAELAKILRDLNQSLNESKMDAASNLSVSRELVGEIKAVNNKLEVLSGNCDQMNCDSKDVNQNIQQIKSFFEQIEKHLDLK